MSAEQVRRLLGPPDDVLISSEQFPPGELRDLPPEGGEIWCYGTGGRLAFATLGKVAFNADGRAVAVTGAYGKPIEPSALPEAELRTLLGELALLPGVFGQRDSRVPGRWLTAANRLHSLGRERALAVIEEYLRVRTYAFAPHEYRQDGPHALHTLMRLLFPAAPETWGGLDEIVKAGDVPLVLRYRGGIAGSVSFSLDELELYRKNGVWRQAPYTPVPNPLEAVDAVCKQPDNAGRVAELRGQALLFLRTVYRPDDGRTLRRQEVLLGPRAEVIWAKARSELARLQLRWNAERGVYTFADGTMLPPEWPAVHWNAAGSAFPLEIQLRRTDGSGIRIEAVWSGPNPKTPLVLAARRIRRAKAERRPIRTWILEPGKPWSSWLELAEGEGSIELEISTGPVTRTSPVFEL